MVYFLAWGIGGFYICVYVMELDVVCLTTFTFEESISELVERISTNPELITCQGRDFHVVNCPEGLDNVHRLLAC